MPRDKRLIYCFWFHNYRFNSNILTTYIDNIYSLQKVAKRLTQLRLELRTSSFVIQVDLGSTDWCAFRDFSIQLRHRATWLVEDVYDFFKQWLLIHTRVRGKQCMLIRIEAKLVQLPSTQENTGTASEFHISNNLWVHILSINPLSHFSKFSINFSIKKFNPRQSKFQ